MGSLKKSSSYSDLIISVFGSSCEQRRRCSSAGFLTVNNVKCKWTTSGHNSTRSGPSDKPLHSKVKVRARTPENVDTGLIAQEICVCFRLKQVELNHAAMEGEPLHCLSLLFFKKTSRIVWLLVRLVKLHDPLRAPGNEPAERGHMCSLWKSWRRELPPWGSALRNENE